MAVTVLLQLVRVPQVEVVAGEVEDGAVQCLWQALNGGDGQGSRVVVEGHVEVGSDGDDARDWRGHGASKCVAAHVYSGPGMP